MHKNICAPNKYDKKNQTCFQIEQLIEMAGAYNRYLAKNKLNPAINRTHGGAELIVIKSDKPYLLQEIKKRFETVCDNNDEVCITQQSFMNEIEKEMRYDIVSNTFRPLGPTKSNEWLSTVDIDNIMYQYENIYPDFKFYGAVPLDCNELNFCSLYKINFDNLQKKHINKLGIIFNMDRHGQPGSHWVALYIDISNGKIYYCNSTGHAPIDNIRSIIEQFTQYYKNKTGKNAVYDYNKKSYQRDSSECGVYSCNFLIRMLAGEDFDHIINTALSFKEINSCRNSYFRNTPSKYNPDSKCDPGL